MAFTFEEASHLAENPSHLKPKGFFFKRCPCCNHRLKKEKAEPDLHIHIGSDCWEKLWYDVYTCPECSYIYSTQRIFP